MKRSLKWILSLLLLLIIGGVSFFSWWYFSETPIISPLNSRTTFNFINQEIPASSGKLVYGFLPYWNVDNFTQQPEMTHLAYFGLTIQPDGTLATRLDGATEPGYRQLQSDEFLEISQQLSANQQQLELVLLQLNSDEIQQLLQNKQAINNLLISLDSILLAYPVSGINIDIEYDGLVTDQLQQNFTDLVAAVDQHLDQKYDQVQLSIDIYASAGNKRYLWDLPSLEPHVDHVIVMAYDFHRRSSTQAGPIAPLFGGDDYWDNDINQSLAAILKIIPKEKVLLGIPFYGYQWQTTSRDSQAQTFPQTGITMSFASVTNLLTQASQLNDELQLQNNWNPIALSPYLTYEEDGETYVLYYENSRSLSYKLDYVNQLDLGGIAIWALGYEADSRQLWEVISKKL